MRSFNGTKLISPIFLDQTMIMFVQCSLLEASMLEKQFRIPDVENGVNCFYRYELLITLAGLHSSFVLIIKLHTCLLSRVALNITLL